MYQKILENVKAIEFLKQENKNLNEQIKNEGIESVNMLLNSLYLRLKLYLPIIRKFQFGVNVKTDKYYTIEYRGTSHVHIISDYSNDTWKLLFNNYNIDLNKGINNINIYKVFCEDNPVLEELDFDEISRKIEEQINNTLENIKMKETEKRNKKLESLNSFKRIVENNISLTLNKLFKMRDEHRASGDLDLIEPILKEIDILENQINKNNLKQL